jgi:hypothetical protein
MVPWRKSNTVPQCHAHVQGAVCRGVKEDSLLKVMPAVISATPVLLLLSTVYCRLLMSTWGHKLSAEQLLRTA